jgi:FkbM family methyltransferase
MDIGSNHGCYALLAGTLHPRNQVFAFEPQPNVAEALRISVSANMLKNVTVVETVVSDTVGDCRFFCPKTGSGIGSLSRAQAEQSVSAIELKRISTTIDQFVHDNNLQQLDIMKVDVEGFEYQVFRGASETLRKYRPIIWFEMNASALRKTGTSQEAVYSLLRECNYRWFYDVSTLHQTPRQLDGQVEQVTNILAIPDGKKHTLETLFHRIQQQVS